MLALTGCSRQEEEPNTTPAASSGATTEAARVSEPAPELHLGYFGNVTHATALIGTNQGFFADELGDTELTTATFNAGPEEMGALLGGSIDIAFIGPGRRSTASPSPMARRSG